MCHLVGVGICEVVADLRKGAYQTLERSVSGKVSQPIANRNARPSKFVGAPLCRAVSRGNRVGAAFIFQKARSAHCLWASVFGSGSPTTTRSEARESSKPVSVGVLLL